MESEGLKRSVVFEPADPGAAGRHLPPTGWQGSLHLNYRCDRHSGAARTVVHDRHSGPLRVLASLYPEGDAVCHNVLVHPPGGIAGGDELRIDVQLEGQAHALITTPGATRFYRSTGATAKQTVNLALAAEARLEWLPLETLAYSGCRGENHLRMTLAPGAEMIGWDLLALGLPASNLAFERGHFAQHIELAGRWLERGAIDASDTRLLDSALGWAGHRAMGTIWFAAGTPLHNDRRDALLDSARAVIDGHALQATAGASAPDSAVVVMRVLAPRVEPIMGLLTAVWARWRQSAWALQAHPPRVWRT